MKSKNKYRWECWWTNGKGGFDPDREDCTCHGKFGTSLKTAVLKGLEHNKKHGWSSWGYAPLDWENDTAVIECKTPSRKTKCLGKCSEYEAVIKKTKKSVVPKETVVFEAE